MANLDFPTSPTTGQMYSANGKTWRFDGVSWKSYNTLGIASGGTGLTAINAPNAFLSSDSAGTALTYRTFESGTGINITIDENSVLFTSTGGGGAGTVDYGSLNTLAYYPSAGNAVTGTQGLTFDANAVSLSANKFVGNLSGSAVTANNFYGALTGTATTANYSHQSGYAITAGKWGTARTVTFSGGDVTGNFSIDGSADVSGVNLTIGANSVALGTDTTGQYASTISVNGLGITATQANADDGTSYVIYSSASSSSGSSSLVLRDINGGFSAGIVTASEFIGNITGTAATFTDIYGSLIGTATTAQNVILQTTNANSEHKVIFSTDNTSSGAALSVNSTLVYNPFNDKLTVSSLAVTSPVVATSTSTGALVVTGGVGIGDSLYVGGLASQISGLAISNSKITQGIWAGTLISHDYGGTGYASYNKGDLLVGTTAGHLETLPVGSDNQLLTASSFSGVGLSWKSYSDAIYGAFASTTTQAVLSAYGTTVISFDTIYSSNGISITPIGAGLARTTRIYFSETGVYNIQFSAQLNRSVSATDAEAEIWFRKNGVNVPQSNTRQTITGKDLESVLTVNFVDSFISTNYIELVLWGSDSDVNINHFPAGGGRPEIPSIITTVTPVSYLLPGSGTAISGIVQLNNQTGGSQTLLTGTGGNDFDIVSASNVHTFNLPSASITARGLVTNLAQTFGGDKTFAGAIAITNTTTTTSPITGSFVNYGGLGISGSVSIGQTLYLYSPISDYSIGLRSGSLTGSTIYTLPSTTPQSSIGTSVLSSTINGVMSWVPMTASSPGGSGTVGSGAANKLAYYKDAGTAVTDTYGMNYNLSGTASTFTIFGGASLGNTAFIVQAISSTSVRVGIGITNPQYALEVEGEISATSLNVKNANTIRFYNSANTKYVGLKYTGSVGNIDYILPDTAASAGVSYLTSTAAGQLAFAEPPKLTHRIQLATAYNPTVGADSAVYMIPYSYGDGTSSVTYRLRRADCRVETSSTVGSTFSIEKYSINAGIGTFAFSTSSTGSTTNIMSAPLTIAGLGTHETFTTSFAFAGSLITSGDKVRLNFSGVSAIHQNFSISLTMEQN